MMTYFANPFAENQRPRGVDHDTAIVLKRVDELGALWSRADYQFYSPHRAVLTLETLERRGYVRKYQRGQYFVTEEGRRWISRTLSGARDFTENPTFRQTRDALLSGLRERGWDVTTYSRGRSLKVPYATSPDGVVRFWFKPQAIYYTVVDPPFSHDFKAARSVSIDMRAETVESLLADAARLAR